MEQHSTSLPLLQHFLANHCTATTHSYQLQPLHPQCYATLLPLLHHTLQQCTLRMPLLQSHLIANFFCTAITTTTHNNASAPYSNTKHLIPLSWSSSWECHWLLPLCQHCNKTKLPLYLAAMAVHKTFLQFFACGAKNCANHQQQKMTTLCTKHNTMAWNAKP